MFSARGFRRRWILAIFVVIFVLFFIYSTLDKAKDPAIDTYQIQHTLLRQTFQWQPKVRDVDSNSSNIVRCRNSVQGKQYIVDERGFVCERNNLMTRGCCDMMKTSKSRKSFVCERNDLTTGGCCDVKTSKSTQYNCSTCKTNGCCIIYEHCVSCCLQPEKQPILKRVLQQANEGVDKLIASVSDHFELCLAKCRTSSRSVQHENSYRDPKAKHCYGEDPPDLQMVVT